ncbi:MAG: toll/interleukin-1 receptor domain-containing protein [Acidobacteria bacterium]|nr:toll/interleukin-1 receptor domain-containing protein [Acidobacteriota bacterium]
MPAFISYSQKDQGPFTSLSEALTGHGIEVWDAAAIMAGSSLADQLRDGIKKCAVCVLLATQNSLKSSWCLAEVGAFWGAGVDVIIFKGESNLDEDLFPQQFKGNLWTEDVKRVREAVKAALSKQGCSDPADDLKGDWVSKYISTYMKGTPVLVEDVRVEACGGQVAIISDHNPKNDNYTASCELVHEKHLVGEWESTRPGSSANGAFMLTIGPTGDFMYGCFAAPDRSGRVVFANWVLARKGDNAMVEELLSQGEEILDQSFQTKPTPSIKS